MYKKNQQTIKIAVVVALIAGSIGLLSILATGFGITSNKIFYVCYSLIFFGLFAAPCFVVSENPAYKVLGTSGIVAATLGFLLSCVLFFDGADDEGMLKFIAITILSSFVLAWICFLHHINTQNKYARAARMVATIAISLFAFTIITQLFQPLISIYMVAGNETIMKLIFSCFFITLVATLLVPLCNRLQVAEPVQESSFTEEQQVVQEIPNHEDQKSEE